MKPIRLDGLKDESVQKGVKGSRQKPCLHLISGGEGKLDELSKPELLPQSLAHRAPPADVRQSSKDAIMTRKDTPKITRGERPGSDQAHGEVRERLDPVGQLAALRSRILIYRWDPKKAASNLKKHGVSFEEARGVFTDPLALTFPDPDHSVDETRSITIGRSLRQRILFLAHADRGPDQVRIISSRPATRTEAHAYEESQD